MSSFRLNLHEANSDQKEIRSFTHLYGRSPDLRAMPTIHVEGGKSRNDSQREGAAAGIVLYMYGNGNKDVIVDE